MKDEVRPSKKNGPDAQEQPVTAASELSEVESLQRKVAELEARIASDAVDRARLDRLLRDSEEQRRALLGNVPDIVSRFDRDYRFLSISPAVEQFTGAPPEFYIGKNHREAGVPEDISQYLEAALQKIFESGQPQTVEFDPPFPPGVRHMQGIGIPERGPDGAIHSVLTIVRDVTESKRLEREWRDSEAKFRALVEQSPMPTQVISLEGRLVRANAAWEKLYGVTIEQIGDFNFFTDPQLTERGISPYLLRVRQGETVEIPESPFVPDRGQFAGETLWVRSAAYPIRDEHGEVREVVLVQEHLTERHRAEEAARLAALQLKESQERLDLAVRAHHIGIFDWDIASGKAVWSEQEEELFGLEPGTFEGDIASWTKRIHPEDVQRVWKEFDACWQERREELRFAYRIVRADGAVRSIEGSGRFVYSPDGAPVRLVGANIDVTESRAAAEALRESEERLRLAAAAGQVGLWDWDIPANKVIWSDRVYEFYGLAPGAFPGTVEAFGEMIHDEDRELVLEVLRRAVEQGDPYHVEYRARRPHGELRWLVTSAEVIRDPEGRPVRMVGAVIDITKRRETEDELRKANAELEEFAYVASHDLQEPLRMINIYTQLLRRRALTEDAKAQEYADFVQRGASRMQTLIRDLLSYSGTIHNDAAQSGTADLSEALSQALAALESRIDESDAVIKSELLPMVRGDTGQLAQVFQNLLSNAIKYRRDDAPPEITISARHEPAGWTIAVRDNGIGFASEHSERIFGLFKRLHKNQYPGTGLGLAICRRIIERHEGRIWAESDPDLGSVFYFTLPAA